MSTFPKKPKWIRMWCCVCGSEAGLFKAADHPASFTHAGCTDARRPFKPPRDRQGKRALKAARRGAR